MASLERLPSNLKNMFAGTKSPRSSPENGERKWFNNTPKVDPEQEQQNKMIAQMKNDYNKQMKKQSKEEEKLIKVSDQPSKPWYDDEDDMKELLHKRPSILKEVDMNQDRRLNPEDNAAVIKMYGGVMFPGGPIEKTPKNLLFKIRKALQGDRDNNGFESGLRASTGSSNSSSMSSKKIVE